MSTGDRVIQEPCSRCKGSIGEVVWRTRYGHRFCSFDCVNEHFGKEGRSVLPVAVTRYGEEWDCERCSGHVLQATGERTLSFEYVDLAMNHGIGHPENVCLGCLISAVANKE